MEQQRLPGFEVTEQELVDKWLGGNKESLKAGPQLHVIEVVVPAQPGEAWRYTAKYWTGTQLRAVTVWLKTPTGWKIEVAKSLERDYAAYQAKG